MSTYCVDICKTYKFFSLLLVFFLYHICNRRNGFDCAEVLTGWYHIHLNTYTTCKLWLHKIGITFIFFSCLHELMTICTSKSRNIWCDEFVAVLMIKMTVDSIIFRLESKYFFSELISLREIEKEREGWYTRCRNVNVFELKMARFKTEVWEKDEACWDWRVPIFKCCTCPYYTLDWLVSMFCWSVVSFVFGLHSRAASEHWHHSDSYTVQVFIHVVIKRVK